MSTSSHRTFADIAYDIRQDCKATNQKPFGAAPYLDALAQMHTTDPTATLPGFHLDDARYMSAYLLSNLRTYKGERARELKAELKKLAGIR